MRWITDFCQYTARIRYVTDKTTTGKFTQPTALFTTDASYDKEGRTRVILNKNAGIRNNETLNNYSLLQKYKFHWSCSVGINLFQRHNEKNRIIHTCNIYRVNLFSVC
jgi:hypothetical protein